MEESWVNENFERNFWQEGFVSQVKEDYFFIEALYKKRSPVFFYDTLLIQKK